MKPTLISWTSLAARRLGAASLLGALAAAPQAVATSPAEATAPAGGLSSSTTASSTPGSVPSGHYQVEHSGLRVDLTLDSLAEPRPAGRFEERDPLSVSIRVTDAATGAPMAGLSPAAWLDLIPSAADDGPQACKLKLQNFLSGALLSAPAVSLNSFYVVALNSEPSLTVIDPLSGFGGSKLLALVDLSSPGEDWVLTRDGAWLFVSLPASGRVAVVDTARFKLVTEIETGGRPSRLLLQPDEGYLWVADGSTAAGSGVTVIDTARRTVVGRIATGAGPHDLAVAGDGRHVFVTNETAGTLSVLEVDSLSRRAEIATGPRPVALAYSALSGAVYVSDAVAGTVTVVDAARHQVVAQIEAEPGLGQVRFAPDGRLAFVVNPGADKVHILDGASHRLVQTAEVEDEPYQVSFTDTLAYIRHRASETVMMVPLAAVGEPGRTVPVASFPGGQKAPGSTVPASLAAGIVPADKPTAVLVGNPLDRTIYYYMEGSAAPMGSFQNYGREPRAVLAVDRSLRQSAAGVYEAKARLAGAGVYDLALFVDSPRISHCFRFEVEANPELERQRLAAQGARVDFLTLADEVAVGEPVAVRFRLSDPVSGLPMAGLRDVVARAFLVPGIWQGRLPAVEIAAGLYQVELTPAAAGSYVVQLEAPSARLTVNRSPSLNLQVVERAPAQAAKSNSEPRRTP